MFLCEENTVNSLNVTVDPAVDGSISVRLCNAIFGSVRCWLVNDEGKSLISVNALKSNTYWGANLSKANLQKGTYWMIIHQPSHQFSQEVHIV